ncbi:hypothetical protein AGMMS49936_10030 [Endomicrobiia bacterium]|nr:hypothetical protein AGMMS49936_10030 [Endomicrobiia bacterium]
MLPAKNETVYAPICIWGKNIDTFRIPNSIGSNSVFLRINYDGINITDEARFITKYGHAFFTNYTDRMKNFNETTHKLLAYMIKLLNDNNSKFKIGLNNIDTAVQFPISDYRKIRGVNSYRSLRQQIMQDLELIFNMRIDWWDLNYEYRKEQKYMNFDMRILSSKLVNLQGEVIVNFTTEIANYLLHSPIMLVPTFYWQAGDIAAPIIYKVSTLSRIKRYKSLQDPRIINVKVEDLLHAIQDIKTLKTDRHIERHFKKRLESGLREIYKNRLCTWCYSVGNTSSCSNKQLRSYNLDGNKYVCWNTFKRLVITFRPWTNQNINPK